MQTEDLSGRRFGRWTVLERTPGEGASRWRCRCQCGAERDVLERNLKSGASLSCGCLTRERVRKANRIDLTGARFGRLTALREAPAEGGSAWECRCDCGRECVVPTKLLRSGKRTSCGCDSRRGKARTQDIAGKKFSMMTALYPTEQRDRKGSVIWHCRCDCGKEMDVSYDQLRYGDKISCGCMREKSNRELHTRLIHVAGTSIDLLRSEKPRRRNRTGVTGVYKRRGRYAAEITFQSRTYYLGSYRELQEAALVRKEAEETLHKSAVRFYEAWKRSADANAQWGAENPISIEVKRLDNGEFRVEMLPRIAF